MRGKPATTVKAKTVAAYESAAGKGGKISEVFDLSG